MQCTGQLYYDLMFTLHTCNSRNRYEGKGEISLVEILAHNHTGYLLKQKARSLSDRWPCASLAIGTETSVPTAPILLRRGVTNKHAIVLLTRTVVVRLVMVLVVLSLFNVLSLELSVLVKTVWLFDRDGHDVKDVGRLFENGVHFFKRAKLRLGEEEVDAWEHERIAMKQSAGRS